jgi:hypothetical protein
MRIASLLAVFTLTVSSFIGTAQAGGGGRGGGPGGMGGMGGGFGAPGGTTNSLGINTAFYTNEYELLAAQVTLTDAQKPKVRARVDAMNSELTALLNALPSPAPAGRGGPGGFGGGAAPGGRGATASPALTPEQVKARDDYRFAANQHQVRINSELTEPQRVQWETYKLNTLLEPKTATLNLTDDQKEKIAHLVAETATALAAMTDARDIDTHEGKLVRRVVAEVLTDPQAARLFELPLGTNSGGRGAIGGAPSGGRGGRGGRGG